MKLAIHAVGRMKAGPESDLAQRYLDRLSKAGPAVGLEFAGVTENAESRAQTPVGRKREESAKLESMLGDGAALVLLDERGDNIGSAAFARRLAAIRDGGTARVVFALGGPDGHDEALRSKAALVLSFGKLTWPHQIARIMLAEQLYRAATILAGHPYHRE